MVICHNDNGFSYRNTKNTLCTERSKLSQRKPSKNFCKDVIYNMYHTPGVKGDWKACLLAREFESPALIQCKNHNKKVTVLKNQNQVLKKQQIPRIPLTKLLLMTKVYLTFVLTSETYTLRSTRKSKEEQREAKSLKLKQLMYSILIFAHIY